MQIFPLFHPILSPISPSSSRPSWSLPERKSHFNTRKPPQQLSSLPPPLHPSFLHCLGGNTLHTLWNDTWLGCVLPSQTRAKPHAAIWPISAEGERCKIEEGPTFPRHVPPSTSGRSHISNAKQKCPFLPPLPCPSLKVRRSEKRGRGRGKEEE